MVNALLSALLTPGDLVIMTLAVMVPVQLLYELSIVLATLVERRQARAEREMREAEQVPAPGEA
jgi:Sec-independent protein secretion pathway component TatC